MTDRARGPASPAARIARARELAAESSAEPAASGILSFYADLVGEQQSWLERVAAAPCADIESSLPAIAGLARELLAWLRHAAPPTLADAAGTLTTDSAADWTDLLHRYWSAERHELPDTDHFRLFVVEALLQPFVESSRPLEPATPGSSRLCRYCGSLPVVATLREHGHGTRRALVCGLCLAEFQAPRLTCTTCGEHRFEALPVYRAEQVPGVRIDACDSCRTFIKTLDLSTRARAVPVVDDLATVALDLWAAEQGYRKSRPNLLRI